MSEVEQYFESLNASDKDALEVIRHAVKRIASEAEEGINYGMPAFKYKKKYLIGYAAFKEHLSIFPTPGPIEILKDELKSFVIAKGTIQFTRESPIGDKLLVLIIQLRIKEIEKELLA